MFGQAIGPKYDGKELRRVVNDLVGDLTLKQTLTNVVIPAFDIKILQPVIFTTNDVSFIIRCDKRLIFFKLKLINTVVVFFKIYIC